MPQDQRRLLPIFLFVLLIFTVSSIPSLRAPGPAFVSKDKIAHIVEYFVLGVLLFRGFRWAVGRSRVATFGFLFAVGVSVAGLDEVYQSFIPGRMMSIEDWCADAIGVALGVGLHVFTNLGRQPREGLPGGFRIREDKIT